MIIILDQHNPELSRRRTCKLFHLCSNLFRFCILYLLSLIVRIGKRKHGRAQNHNQRQHVDVNRRITKAL